MDEAPSIKTGTYYGLKRPTARVAGGWVERGSPSKRQKISHKNA
jgi:hypothetical protein